MDAKPLLRAFSELEDSILYEEEGPGLQAARLRLILSLNQEIGKAATSDPTHAPWLKALQRRVNVVTVAVKMKSEENAKLALKEATTSLRELLDVLHAP
ncbi:MAG TPA: hypothetical protein VLY21_05640 [Nitrososphaerales archaeon]|nr:hypothetical protein [Nitrososphaerales archaeon]HUK75330.1 hypothetical protein [Nitrososphaerales archaeon]